MESAAPENKSAHGARRLNICTDEELKEFWREILLDFLEFVDPDSGFLIDLYSGGEILTDTDYESLVAGKDHVPRKQRARKLWRILSLCPLSIFNLSVAPKLCAAYAAIIPEKYYSSQEESIPNDREDTAEPYCLRHAIQHHSKIRLETLADLLCHHRCLSPEAYGAIIMTASSNAENKWDQLFDAIARSPQQLATSLDTPLRQLLNRYHVTCPEDMADPLSAGFSCACPHPQPSPPKTTINSSKQVQSWLERRLSHHPSPDSSLTRVDLSSDSLSVSSSPRSAAYLDRSSSSSYEKIPPRLKIPETSLKVHTAVKQYSAGQTGPLTAESSDNTSNVSSNADVQKTIHERSKNSRSYPTDGKPKHENAIHVGGVKAEDIDKISVLPSESQVEDFVVLTQPETCDVSTLNSKMESGKLTKSRLDIEDDVGENTPLSGFLSYCTDTTGHRDTQEDWGLSNHSPRSGKCEHPLHDTEYTFGFKNFWKRFQECVEYYDDSFCNILSKEWQATKQNLRKSSQKCTHYTNIIFCVACFSTAPLPKQLFKTLWRTVPVFCLLCVFLYALGLIYSKPAPALEIIALPLLYFSLLLLVLFLIFVLVYPIFWGLKLLLNQFLASFFVLIRSVFNKLYRTAYRVKGI